MCLVDDLFVGFEFFEVCCYVGYVVGLRVDGGWLFWWVEVKVFVGVLFDMGVEVLGVFLLE